MTRQHIPYRMSLPPPASAISFVSRLVLSVIAIFLAGVVVASAPRSVMLSILVALGGVLVVGGIAAAIAHARPVRLRPARAAARSGAADGGSRADDRFDGGVPARELAWLTLGLGSMAMLALALVVPDDVGAVLAAVAFTGLAVFRVSVGWAFRVPRDGPFDGPRDPTRRTAREDPHVAGAGPSGPPTRLAAA